MASSNENVSMALFCDFENVALGVRDANYEKFDIKPVLERLLLKGSIVVKKAYCDWDRYKAFKAPMHEGNFELIEIPHVRQSGKNSADIRMVVDALDLCYTKSHVNTFVIISGDSDFSPLVSKLRENNKKVIGVGVKQSTSDLLVANCDEFIFYDDLVRESRRMAAKRDPREGQPAVKRTPEEEKHRRDDMDKRRTQAVEMAVETFDALVSERGDSGKIWASVLKEAIKRRKPDFSESYYGFRTFGNLLEEAKARGLLEFGRDEKSGAYVYRSSGTPSGATGSGEGAQHEAASVVAAVAAEPAEGRQEGRRGRSRGGRKQGDRKGFPHASNEAVTDDIADELQVAVAENAYAEAEAAQAAGDADMGLHAPALSDDDAEAAAEDAALDAAANGNVQSRNNDKHSNDKRNNAARNSEARKSPAKKPARAVKAAQVKAAQVQEVAPSPWQQFAPVPEHAPEPEPVAAQAEVAPLEIEEAAPAAPAKSRTRAPAKGRSKAGAARISAVAAEAAAATEAPVTPTVEQPVQAVEADAPPADIAAASKPAARGPRRPRKPAAAK